MCSVCSAVSGCRIYAACRRFDRHRLGCMQAATLARGRSVRQSKLLFYGKLAEKALQTYERDGWGEFPTNIVVERREIRPTADRGPILLCVDTSGKSILLCMCKLSCQHSTGVLSVPHILHEQSQEHSSNSTPTVMSPLCRILSSAAYSRTKCLSSCLSCKTMEETPLQLQAFSNASYPV